MLLKALNNLYDALAEEENPKYYLTRNGENRHRILWKGTLSKEGELMAVVPVKTKESKTGEGAGKTTTQMLVPWMPGTPPSGSKPMPQPGFARKTEDAFGLNARAVKYFPLWVKLHENLDDPDPSLKIFRSFLEKWSETIGKKGQGKRFLELTGLEEIKPEDLKGGVVFQIDGETEYIHQKRWAKSAALTPEDKKAGGLVGLCPILETELPLVELHPKIGKNPLVSTNKPTFESYGMTREISGISALAAERYGKALNTLLSENCRESHTGNLGGTQIVFWTSPTLGGEPIVQELTGWGKLADKKEAQAQGELGEAKETVLAVGQGSTRDHSAVVHILGMLPNMGRTAVRFYHEIELRKLEENVRKHEEDCTPQGWKITKFETWKILAATQGSPELDGESLLRAILENRPYPEKLAAKAVQRLGNMSRLGKKKRTDKEKDWENYSCPALQRLLTGWLKRKRKHRAMTENGPSKAYRLGQLLNLMERCQRESNGKQDVNKGITERFGKMLAENPGKSLAKALLLHRSHLKKLKRENPGLAGWFDKQVRETLGGLETLPKRVNREEQAEFWLGYYAKDSKKETQEIV
jgi:CRISPR-associated protein Cas8c/Csd1 subtype I-C